MRNWHFENGKVVFDDPREERYYVWHDRIDLLLDILMVVLIIIMIAMLLTLTVWTLCFG